MEDNKTNKELQEKSSTEISPEIKAMLDAAAKEQSEGEQGGIPFISLKGKKFSVGDVKLGTSLVCVIISDVFDHSWYDRKYDPKSDEVFPPACFAMGKDISSMAPHENAPDKQSESCSTCHKNEFGSADTGKGKACRNGRRLLIASVDENGNVNFNDLAIINISPTALKGYSKYVKSINNIKKLPVWAVTTVLTFDEDAPYPIVTPIFGSLVKGEDIGKITESINEFYDMVAIPYDVSNYEKPDDAAATAKKSKMS